ncbi:hypothetical protein [Bacillus salipaludis]|nr:hypothetical protein [Bacillus salipaludis]
MVFMKRMKAKTCSKSLENGLHKADESQNAWQGLENGLHSPDESQNA